MGIIGIPIGIYGYLFPGNINLMVMELYHSRRYRFLWLVLIVIVLFESIYCSVSLIFLSSIRTNLHLYSAIELASVILVFIMGLWMMLENKKRNSAARSNVITRGIISIVIHPQQVPFWVIAGVIVSKFIPINVDKWQLAEFVLFNAIGTIIAMGIYMLVGNKLLLHLNINLSRINRIMGLGYVILSAYHLCGIFIVPDVGKYVHLFASNFHFITAYCL